MRQFPSAVLAATCLVLAWGAAPAKADYTPLGGTVYIGSPDDYFQYTGWVEDATGRVMITGTLVFDGQPYEVVAEGWVRPSGVKSPPKKRYVATGAATASGLGDVAVSDAYGSTRDEAVTNFVNNVVAGVVIRVL
jgi:hypothetical protein